MYVAYSRVGKPSALLVYASDNQTKKNWYHKHCSENIITSFLHSNNKNVLNYGTGGIYVLDAPSWTGKTFLISLILATIRSHDEIALALVSSGIAATLLEGDRTAHSALKSPLNIQSNETPTCNISKNSAMTKILQQCNLIVWDECTTTHKNIFGGIRQNYETSTVNASGWTQCMFNFWRISIFCCCYCQKKVVIKEKN